MLVAPDLQKHLNFRWAHLSCIQQQRMYMDSDRFCFKLLSENALSLVFYTCIIVGGCGFPIYTRFASSGTVSCAFINDAPISASAADAMTFVIIFHTL